MTKERTKTSDESQVRQAVRQRERATREPKQEPKAKARRFLSTGSTMLNLAMSDSVDGGWPLGNISTMPGKSAAGKTVVVLSTFAEACINPFFEDYVLIYDDVERRCDFNLDKLFAVVTDRLITPSGLLYSELRGHEDKSGISNTIEDVELSITKLLEEGRPFVYIIDSLDALSTDEEAEKEVLKALALAKSKEHAEKIAQAHAARKAGIIHRMLRNINGSIASTGSLFILTQQLKQKIGAKQFERKWKTSGGEGPYFYSQVRPFLTKAGSRKASGCEIGIDTEVVMDKNSVTGKIRNVKFSIYNELGIDDTGSMVDFLLDQGRWKSGQWIKAPEFDLKENGRDKLTRAIEKVNGFRPVLKRLTQEAWDRREESLLLKRPSRYSK